MGYCVGDENHTHLHDALWALCTHTNMCVCVNVHVCVCSFCACVCGRVGSGGVESWGDVSPHRQTGEYHCTHSHNHVHTNIVHVYLSCPSYTVACSGSLLHNIRCECPVSSVIHDPSHLTKPC